MNEFIIEITNGNISNNLTYFGSYGSDWKRFFSGVFGVAIFGGGG